MNYISNIMHAVSEQLGHITSQMDSNAWIALSALSVVAGYFFLRGNMLKST